MAYRTSEKTQLKKDLKRAHILLTAVKVFSIKGYHHTTVKDVVDEAGISVGTFYFYFKNKEDLFSEMYDEVSTKFLEMLLEAYSKFENQIDEGFSKAITYFLRIIDHSRPLAKIMLIESVGLNSNFERKRGEVTQSFANITAEYFELMLEKKLIKATDSNLWALAFIGTLYNVIMKWLQTEPIFPLTDYAYGLSVYNLQALGIDYDPSAIQNGIEKMMTIPLNLPEMKE